jgi:hydrogenase large subunit
VKKTRNSGTLFRGLELILRGKNPKDAPSLALEEAFGIADEIPDNGRIIRNLILGSNFL